jgi:hypothetical protein
MSRAESLPRVSEKQGNLLQGLHLKYGRPAFPLWLEVLGMLEVVSLRTRAILRPIRPLSPNPSSSWRSQHPDHYIGVIVISVGGFFKSSDYPDEPRPRLLRAMLIERAEEANDIAFRVQLCEDYTPLDS